MVLPAKQCPVLGRYQVNKCQDIWFEYVREAPLHTPGSFSLDSLLLISQGPHLPQTTALHIRGFLLPASLSTPET